MKRLFLDTCVVIYLVERIAPWCDKVVDHLKAEGPITLCTSDLVRLEALVKPIRDADGALKQRFEATFSHYETLELNAEVYTMAAELRARHGWRTPDAIHAATAIIHSVDEFWTNDLRLDGKDSRLVVRVVT